jgi:hypothetical protein
MAKTRALQVAIAKNDTMSYLESGTRFAKEIQIDLTAPIANRWIAAKEQEEASKRYFAAHGLLLLSLKSEIEHGRFIEELESRGFELRQAQRAMSYAKFVFSRPKEQQTELLGMAQTKVCELAMADPEVVEDLLESGVDEINALTVKELREQLQSSKAQIANLATALDHAELTAKAAEKALYKAKKGREPGKKPYLIEDIEMEAHAYVRRASLAMEGLGEQVDAAAGLHAPELIEWANGVQKAVLAGVAEVYLKANDLLARCERLRVNAKDVRNLGTAPLANEQVAQAAEQYAAIARIEEYEKSLRKFDRAQARPKGKGRPEAKPVLSDADAALRGASGDE